MSRARALRRRSEPPGAPSDPGAWARRWPRGHRLRSVALEPLLALGAVAAGLLALFAYTNEGLVLSHYDARAHLVVARRVIDSMTPGWKQIGAVWLPLPHLINLFPSQIDVLYRTGAFASAVSIACLGATVWAAARLVRRITGSAIGATAAAALIVLNPNLLYLHVTPMTEPLLLALTFLAALWLFESAEDPLRRHRLRLPAVLFAAMWTRYEAWPVVAAGIGAHGLALWRGGLAGVDALLLTLRLAVWPAAAVLLFVLNSRVTVGDWFVTGGFYVPDPLYEGIAGRTLLAVWWGTHRLTSYLQTIVALTAAAVVLVGVLRRPRLTAHLVPFALFAAALLPLYAFFEGHPFRIRYMVPLAAAAALSGGLAVGLVARSVTNRARASVSGRSAIYAAAGLALPTLAGALLVVSPLIESPGRGAPPMLEEAMWDRPAAQGRRAVAECLRGANGGEKVLASMGSLAHFMHELSAEGFAIADFIHEGNGAIWVMALETGPAPHAGWMLVEEQSEGGDALARRVRSDPTFIRGMARICEGGGVGLYRRQ